MTSYQTPFGTNPRTDNQIMDSNKTPTTSSEQIRVSTPVKRVYSSGTEFQSQQIVPRILGYCSECGMRIVNLNDACHAMGYLYHNSCFVCCCCKCTLRGKVFYKDQDKIYCEEDFLYCGFQKTVEKCSACGHIIAEMILIAMGNAYHPNCFRCCICTKCLDGIPFTIDSHNSIYCLRDYHLVYGPICAVCGLVILPEEGSDEVKRVVALTKEFHVDCYRCMDCKRLLGDQPEHRCYPFDQLDPNNPGRNIQILLCLDCHLQRIGAIPATTAGGTNHHTDNNNHNSGSNNKSNYGLISYASTISNNRHQTTTVTSTNTNSTSTTPNTTNIHHSNTRYSPITTRFNHLNSTIPLNYHKTYLPTSYIRTTYTTSPSATPIYITSLQNKTNPLIHCNNFKSTNQNNQNNDAYHINNNDTTNIISSSTTNNKQ